jgi:hypothetical protein
MLSFLSAPLRALLSFMMLVSVAGILLFTVSACEGDYRPKAIGGHSEILVVMDSVKHDSEVAEALRNTLGAPIFTMPRPQPRFDLIFTDLRTTADRELIERHKNVVIASDIDADTNVGAFLRALLADNVKQSVRDGESFSFTQRDVWSRDQLVMMLSAESSENLAQRISRNEQSLVDDIHQMELARWHRYVYRRAEQTELSEDILETYGWSFRIQHDYRVGVDTLNVLTLRRYLPDNDRWIWVWWQDDFSQNEFDNLGRDWVSTKRDSINQEYMKGSTDEKYVKTDYDRPYEQRFMEINGMQSYESRGIWRMHNELMGGPFINYTMYDHENERLFMMEYGQFSPRWDQRRFLYQFEAMARTFVSNPEAIKEDEEDTPVAQAE